MIDLLKIGFLLVILFGIKSFHGLEAAFWALVLYVAFTNLNFEGKFKNLTSVLNNHSRKISPHLYKEDE
jgi:hypothetical protein